MAAVPDPLAELLLSDVDEAAVSDLVGSLEWRLAGGGAGASPQGSASAHARQRPGGEAAAAAPASGFGREGPAGHRLSPGAAAAPCSPAAETPGTGRPPPPSPPAVVTGNRGSGLAPGTGPAPGPQPLPQAVNGRPPAPAPGTHLPLSATTGARAEPTAASSSSSAPAASLTPRLVAASQASGSSSTPTPTLLTPTLLSPTTLTPTPTLLTPTLLSPTTLTPTPTLLTPTLLSPTTLTPTPTLLTSTLLSPTTLTPTPTLLTSTLLSPTTLTPTPTLLTSTLLSPTTLTPTPTLLSPTTLTPTPTLLTSTLLSPTTLTLTPTPTLLSPTTLTPTPTLLSPTTPTPTLLSPTTLSPTTLTVTPTPVTPTPVTPTPVTPTPTVALHRPPADGGSPCIVSPQNGLGPLTKVNASGLLQVGAGSPIRPGTAGTHFMSHPMSSTGSRSRTKPVLHPQPQPVPLSLLNNTAVTIPVTNLSSNAPHCTVTSTLCALGSTLSVNALPKASVNVIAQPHVTRVVASTQSTVQGPAARAQPSRPGMGPPQRIVAPQFIICPQYQPTVQLASGFTIPPGMILVQTDSGQLIMVPHQALVQAQAQQPGSISPRPSAPTSAATIHLASNQQAVSLSSIRPLQAKVTQPAALVTAPSVTIAQPIGTVTPPPLSGSTSTPQTLHTTTKLGVGSQHLVTSEAAVQSPASPRTPQLSQPASTSRQQAHSQVIPGSPQAGTPTVSQDMQENVKKCKNFLATLIKLASHSGQSADTSRNVKSLVQDLLDTKIEPEEFTNRLQSELKSSPQPHLVPFLKKSLPALRQSLVRNQLGVLQLHQQPQHLQAVVPTQATSTTQTEATVTTVTSGSSARVSAVTGASTVTHAHVNLTRQGKNPRLIVPSPVQALKRQSVGLGTQVRLPMVITPSFRPVVKSQSVQGIKGLPESLQDCTSQKTKLNDSGGGSFRDDHDINDVASMAGLNLNEENANILATNSKSVGTNIHSCKDEAFLASGPLHRRILETAKRFGITDVPIDIVNTVSHATQERLKTVIGKLTTIAQHRMETHKDHEWYEQATDVRTQLKFFEHLERLEKQRKDDQEREILLKAAKSRSRQEDPEQARLKQKAREMQQQELAQMRQRDANLTALAAIGPRKKRRLDSPGPQVIEVGMAAGEGACPTSGFTPTSSRQYARQKVTRINLRDFIFYMEQERDSRHSLSLYRALLK